MGEQNLSPQGIGPVTVHVLRSELEEISVLVHETFFFGGIGVLTQGLYLESLHQPIFVLGIFSRPYVS
jgi:hypothetical protein